MCTRVKYSKYEIKKLFSFNFHLKAIEVSVGIHLLIFPRLTMFETFLNIFCSYLSLIKTALFNS